METYVLTMLEYIRDERLLLLLSMTDPDILKQAGFLDQEKKSKKPCSRKNYKDRNL